MESNGKTSTSLFLVETENMGFTFDVSQTMLAKRKQVAQWWQYVLTDLPLPGIFCQASPTE
jgi:hypothetical protein